VGLVVYLAFGLVTVLAVLRIAKARSASAVAVWTPIAAIALVVAVVSAVRGISTFSDVLFHVLALASVFAAVMVVSQSNPVHSGVWLITVFLCVAVLFILRRAEFLAATQVLIYAGAIMVLYLFIIIFAEIDTLVEEPAPTWMTAAAVGVSLALLLALVPIARGLRPERTLGLTMLGHGSVETIGHALYFGATVPFEVASLILLVALVGAAVIGKAGKGL